MESCIFCLIASGKQKADVVLDSEDYIAFNDIHPKAPIHILIVPKKHIASVSEMQEDDIVLMGGLVHYAKKVAQQVGIANNGYKLIFNVGHGGGQVIDHIHLHLLGGWSGVVQSSVNV